MSDNKSMKCEICQLLEDGYWVEALDHIETRDLPGMAFAVAEGVIHYAPSPSAARGWI